MGMLTDIPQSVIDAFDCGAFEKRREEAGGKWNWNRENRYEALVYIRKKFQRKSIYEITARDFRPLKMNGAFMHDIFNKKHSVMIKSILEPNGICVDLDRFSTRLTPEQESKFFDGNETKVPPEGTVGNIPNDIIDAFNITEFEKWNKDNKSMGKWSNRTRYYLTIYLMKKNKLTSIYQLDTTHFLAVGCLGSFCEFKRHSTMIVNVLAENNIVVDGRRFTVVLTQEEREEFFKNVPKIEPTPEHIKKKQETVNLIAKIPKLVRKVLKNPLKYEANIDNIKGDKALVYLGIVNGSLKIVYCGSSHYFDKRNRHHHSTAKKVAEDEINEDVHKFQKYIASVEGGVTLIPICICYHGFERLVEAAFYDCLKLAQEEGKNVDLQNGCRPISEKYTTDSYSVLYAWYKGSKLIYCGTTEDYFNRLSSHISACYTKKIKTKFYDYLRSLDSEFLPKDVEMKPVLLIPIGMRHEQENLFIKSNNLMVEGFNAVSASVTGEERKLKDKERQDAYSKKKQEVNRVVVQNSIPSCSTDVPIIVAKPLRLKKDFQ